MGNKEFCCQIIRKPDENEKKQNVLLNYLACLTSVNHCLDKIRCYLFMNQTIYGLAIYLNGIYCFLLEVKDRMVNDDFAYSFSNKSIQNLRAILQDLGQNLDFRQSENFDFVRSSTSNQILVNIVKHLEISFRMNCTQNHFFALDTIKALQGEFSLDFSELEYRVSTFLLSEEEEMDFFLECKIKIQYFL